ncbi:Zn-dependent hydrolase, partial [Candidatus Bathyarchaeota archaeon]
MTIVTDPHDGVSLGLPPPRVKADVILISHGHDDHASGRSLVGKPDAVVIDEPGAYMVKGARIKGVKAFHDDVQGR